MKVKMKLSKSLLHSQKYQRPAPWRTPFGANSTSVVRLLHISPFPSNCFYFAPQSVFAITSRKLLYVGFALRRGQRPDPGQLSAYHSAIVALTEEVVELRALAAQSRWIDTKLDRDGGPPLRHLLEAFVRNGNYPLVRNLAPISKLVAADDCFDFFATHERRAKSLFGA